MCKTPHLKSIAYIALLQSEKGMGVVGFYKHFTPSGVKSVMINPPRD